MIIETSKTTLEILRLIATEPGITAKDIGEEIGLSSSTARNHLDTLESENLIENRNGRYYAGEGLAALYHFAVRQFGKEAEEAARKIERATLGEAPAIIFKKNDDREIKTGGTY